MIQYRVQALVQIQHIECAGLGVNKADTDQQKGCADRAHDQVLIGGGQCTTFPAHRDQHIGRQRGYFQEHEQVEYITRLYDAQQANQAEQKCGIEQRCLFSGISFSTLRRA